MKIIITIPFLLQSLKLLSQDCSNISTEISRQYTYNNKEENFSLSLNESCDTAMQNKGGVIVGFIDKNKNGSLAIAKNKNGYIIKSAHEITEKLVYKLFEAANVDSYNESISNENVRNVRTKMVEYDYKYHNLDETYYMSGILFLFIKNDYTIIFMFNCDQAAKDCYFPFYKDVMKNMNFGEEWY